MNSRAWRYNPKWQVDVAGQAQRGKTRNPHLLRFFLPLAQPTPTVVSAISTQFALSPLIRTIIVKSLQPSKRIPARSCSRQPPIRSVSFTYNMWKLALQKITALCLASASLRFHLLGFFVSLRFILGFMVGGRYVEFWLVGLRLGQRSG